MLRVPKLFSLSLNANPTAPIYIPNPPQVRYWADSEGFHQEDNLPKVVLEPAQETEEVRQARLAHEQAWKEAAAAAAQQPDPQ